MTSKLAIFTTALLLSSAAAHADVSISKKPTQNMSCDAGVCTATAQKAVLNVVDLQNMLASGDIAVKTGSVTNNIDIDQPLTWTNTSRLTLNAQQSVIVNKPVTVAGTGALTVATNDGDQNGEFAVVPKHGNVQFLDLSSNLIIDGNTYALVGDIKTLAADIMANPSGDFALAKPYDASTDGEYSTPPIQTSLSGIFDGLGNTISNVSIDTAGIQFVGLFARTDPGGVLRDAVLKGIHIVSATQIDQSGIGTLVGFNDGKISRSFAQGSVSIPTTTGVQYVYAGGLVGLMLEGAITNSDASVDVSGFDTPVEGGLAGSGGGGLIQNSSASGSVSESTANGRLLIGGLVGAGGNPVMNSYSTGSVRAPGALGAGGLIGVTDGSVQASFSSASVEIGGGQGVGGLIGGSCHSTIANSYAIGNVNGGSADGVGGLLGYFCTLNHDGSVASSYSTGSVSGTSYVGGFIGHRKTQKNTAKLDYWDVETSGTVKATGNGRDGGITGLTTDQLKSGLPDGFDPAIWGQSPDINNGYPYLLANPPPK